MFKDIHFDAIGSRESLEKTQMLKNSMLSRKIIVISYNGIKKPLKRIYANLARVTKTPVSSKLRKLTEELNESYLAVKNISEHLEEI